MRLKKTVIFVPVKGGTHVEMSLLGRETDGMLGM